MTDGPIPTHRERKKRRPRWTCYVCKRPIENSPGPVLIIGEHGTLARHRLCYPGSRRYMMAMGAELSPTWRRVLASKPFQQGDLFEEDAEHGPDHGACAPGALDDSGTGGPGVDVPSDTDGADSGVSRPQDDHGTED